MEKFDIVKQEKNVFLQRREFLINIEKQGNPTEKEIIDKLGEKEELSIVKTINSSFGNNKFQADVFVYDSLEARKEIEKLGKKQKEKLKSDAEATEANAEPVQEQTPAPAGEKKGEKSGEVKEDAKAEEPKKDKPKEVDGDK